MKRVLAWFTVQRLVTAILFVAIFAMAVREPVDTDTWWHLLAGRVSVERGEILRSDLFSHTRYGAPWTAYAWLSEVLLFTIFDRFSYAGLALWIAAMVAGTAAFVYKQMEGDPFSRAFVLVLGMTATALTWTARPHMTSFFFTAVVGYVLYLFKWRGINRLWVLPPLFVVWVNLHAGYTLGFMVMVAFVGGEVLNRLLARALPGSDPTVSWRGIGWVVLVGMVCALALLINPNTTQMWTYYLETVRIGALQDFIQEWQSPDFHPLFTQPFIWLLLATVGAMGLSGRRVDGTDLALVALFTYAALLAVRNIAPFALVATPVLSRHVTAVMERVGWAARLRRPPRSSAGMGALNLALLGLVAVAALAVIQPPLRAEANEAAAREALPVDAAGWILEHRPAGELFNPYNWGGYLAWRLWPEYGVFVDGRTDLYGDEVLGEYVTVQLARPGFEDVLEGYSVNLVLTYPDDALSAQLRCVGGWREVYRDEVAVVFVRGAGDG
ncbi:MAG: hypothetical protein JXD18_08890 [Anaerolineae bacterium]|nr:hypothetical protein [Anaerolineae bacterium]